MNTLSIKEIVGNYFENESYGDTPDVNDPETVKAIREYMEEEGIVELNAVRRLIDLENPLENAGLKEIIEYAFELYESVIKPNPPKELIRIRNYLIAIEKLISMPYGDIINDLTKLRGEEHLAFVIDFMNRRFSDPEMSEYYKVRIIFYLHDHEACKLFFKYVLNNVIEGADVRPGAISLNLNEKFLHSLCFMGIEVLSTYNVRTKSIFQLVDYSFELHNLLTIIIRKGYYKEAGKSSKIAIILIYNILYGIHKELEKLIINADETLLRMMIPELRSYIAKKQHFMYINEVEEEVSSIIEFLREFPIDKLPCCKTEWRRMVYAITQ